MSGFVKTESCLCINILSRQRLGRRDEATAPSMPPGFAGCWKLLSISGRGAEAISAWPRAAANASSRLGISKRPAARRVGFKRLAPKDLRTTFASQLLTHGVRIEPLSRWLGHATTAITETAYTHWVSDRLEQMYATENDLGVYLRESNTLTSTVYLGYAGFSSRMESDSLGSRGEGV